MQVTLSLTEVNTIARALLSLRSQMVFMKDAVASTDAERRYAIRKIDEIDNTLETLHKV